MATVLDRKSTRLNSSHLGISYAVFCLKKKQNCTIAAASNYEGAPIKAHAVQRAGLWTAAPGTTHLAPVILTPPLLTSFFFFFFKEPAAPGNFPFSPPRSFPD